MRVFEYILISLGALFLWGWMKDNASNYRGRAEMRRWRDLHKQNFESGEKDKTP